MLVLRIIATVFLGLSCLSCLAKNICCFENAEKETYDTFDIVIATLYGLIWRAFVITTLWLV